MEGSTKKNVTILMQYLTKRRRVWLVGDMIVRQKNDENSPSHSSKRTKTFYYNAYTTSLDIQFSLELNDT